MGVRQASVLIACNLQVAGRLIFVVLLILILQ